MLEAKYYDIKRNGKVSGVVLDYFESSTNGQWCIVCVAGSQAAFQKVYEGPIVLARQPTATAEEREVGNARAEEVR